MFCFFFFRGKKNNRRIKNGNVYRFFFSWTGRKFESVHVQWILMTNQALTNSWFKPNILAVSKMNKKVNFSFMIVQNFKRRTFIALHETKRQTIFLFISIATRFFACFVIGTSAEAWFSSFISGTYSFDYEPRRVSIFTKIVGALKTVIFKSLN